MPKISVIIPSYNSAKYLPEAIKSALNQTYQDFEIMVVDDGSTDGTRDIMDPFIKEFPEKIRYIYQKNTGLAIARNTAISYAQGEFLALLDADDVWLPIRLEEGVRVIEADPQIGLVHGNITRIDENNTILSTPNRELEYLSSNIFENLFLRKAHIACPTVLFRKSCCDKVGLFDPNLTRLGCEDRDLWLRVAKEYKIVYVDKVLAFYRMSPNSMSQNQDKMLKARLYVIDKYCLANNEKDRLRNRALAKIFRDLGDEALSRKNFAEARSQYYKAIHSDPFACWAWINLLKAILQVRKTGTLQTKQDSLYA